MEHLTVPEEFVEHLIEELTQDRAGPYIEGTGNSSGRMGFAGGWLLFSKPEHGYVKIRATEEFQLLKNIYNNLLAEIKSQMDAEKSEKTSENTEEEN